MRKSLFSYVDYEMLVLLQKSSDLRELAKLTGYCGETINRSMDKLRILEMVKPRYTLRYGDDKLYRLPNYIITPKGIEFLKLIDEGITKRAFTI